MLSVVFVFKLVRQFSGVPTNRLPGVWHHAVSYAASHTVSHAVTLAAPDGVYICRGPAELQRRVRHWIRVPGGAAERDLVGSDVHQREQRG
jgi:hypothetical protein